MEQIRYIEYKGAKYLRAEDVIYYIDGIAATEDIDTKSRLDEACKNIAKSCGIERHYSKPL